MRHAARAGCLLGTVLALGACGSSSHHTATQSLHRAKASLAAVRTPSDAPRYCKTLTGSEAVRGLSSAMAALAANSGDQAAHDTVRQAAATMRASAAQSPADSRPVLLAAADALRQLDQQGLAAASSVNIALQNAGQTLERPCAFPVG
jgi:hypothetical protein